MRFINKYICENENDAVNHGYFHKGEIVNLYDVDMPLFTMYSLEGDKYKFLIDDINVGIRMYGLISIKEYRKRKLIRINENTNNT